MFDELCELRRGKSKVRSSLLQTSAKEVNTVLIDSKNETERNMYREKITKNPLRNFQASTHARVTYKSRTDGEFRSDR